MRFLASLAVLFILTVPARADVVDEAFENAFIQFESVYPWLAGQEFGVDTAAYRDALALQRFQSPYWGTPLTLDILRGNGEGSCGRFAAYVPLPPQGNAVQLVVCPQFWQSGTPGLRTLTVLHEMVHVVAGPDECRAMAFAAKIEYLATGTWTPVDRYWRENGCDGSGFSLP